MTPERLRELRSWASTGTQVFSIGAVRECLDYIAELEQQLASPRARLGRWLAAAPDRTWKPFPPDPGSKRYSHRWTIKLAEHGTDVAICDGGTEESAITAALNKAEKQEGGA